MSLEKKMKRVEPIKLQPMAANGMQPLAHRHGGTKALPVLETSPGVFVSAWAIHEKNVARMIASGPCALQLVVDTNVPGHQSVSISIVRVELNDKPSRVE
jgi:hypothetical protein